LSLQVPDQGEVMLTLLLFDDLQSRPAEREFIVAPERPEQLLQMPACHGMTVEDQTPIPVHQQPTAQHSALR
jgi:hypothetical protein